MREKTTKRLPCSYQGGAFTSTRMKLLELGGGYEAPTTSRSFTKNTAKDKNNCPGANEIKV